MKRRYATTALLWAVAVMTAVQIVLVVVRAITSPDALPMLGLIVGVVLTSTAMAVLLIPRRNLSRVETLRAMHPTADVFGAQVAPGTDDIVSRAFPLTPGEGGGFGQLVAVMADSEGISFWKGPGRAPARRALIPWNRVTHVELGSVTLARPLTSVRLAVDATLPDGVTIDIVPNREGLLGYAAVLERSTITRLVTVLESRRVGGARQGRS